MATETHESISSKKRKVLALVEQGFSVAASARELGISTAVVYSWKRADPRFAAELAESYAIGGDFFEDKLREAAAEGSIKAVELGIRIHRPEALREQHQILLPPKQESLDLDSLSDSELAKLIEESEHRQRLLPETCEDAEYVEGANE